MKQNFHKDGACTADRQQDCKFFKPISDKVAWCKFCLLGKNCDSKKAAEGYLHDISASSAQTIYREIQDV